MRTMLMISVMLVPVLLCSACSTGDAVAERPKGGSAESTPGCSGTEAAPSCGGGAPELPRGSYRLTAGPGPVQFPFELVDEHVVIPVRVDGSEPFRLVLDTGMPFYGATLSPSPRSEAIEFENPDGIRVMVPGSGDYEPRVGSGVTLGLPGIEFTGQVVMVHPMPGCDDGGPVLRSDGVIGLSVFDNFVVEIDYDRKMLTLTEPDGFAYSGGGAEIPIRLGPVRMPEVNVLLETEPGHPLPLNMVVDTGAAMEMSLTLGSHENLTLPAGARDLVIGYSNWGEVRGQLGRLRSFSIGDFKLRDALATFFDLNSPGRPPCGENGILGSVVLQRFKVTFDYARSRMFLEPGARFDEPFEFGMTGLVLSRGGAGGNAVARVLPETPASEAGLMEGDVILSVDGRPAEELGREGLRDAMQKLGGIVVLEVLRDDDIITVTLRPRRLV